MFAPQSFIPYEKNMSGAHVFIRLQPANASSASFPSSGENENAATSFGPSAVTRTSAAFAGKPPSNEQMAFPFTRPASVRTSATTTCATCGGLNTLPRSTRAPEPSEVVTDESSNQRFRPPSTSNAAEPAKCVISSPYAWTIFVLTAATAAPGGIAMRQLRTTEPSGQKSTAPQQPSKSQLSTTISVEWLLFTRSGDRYRGSRTYLPDFPSNVHSPTPYLPTPFSLAKPNDGE